MAAAARLSQALGAAAQPLLVVIVPGGHGDPGDRLGLRSAGRRAGIATLYATTGDGFWQLNHRQGDGDVRA